MSSTESPVVAFFDLDKTIIAGSSTLAFSGPLRERGLIGRRALLRSGYAQLLLMVAGADADFMERMRSRISALCAGWDAAEVRSVIEGSIQEILPSMIYTEARALIADHRAAGHRVVVVSASGVEMVEPVARALGADEAVGTRMRVEDGRYTGEIEFYCYGEGKAVAARALAHGQGYRLTDCFAYSDSITDLPLLEAVGRPRAVNPDRALRRLAAERGWPVLDFRPPVALSTRVGRRARSVLAGLPRSLARRARRVTAANPSPAALTVGVVAAATVAGLTAARAGRGGRAAILRSASGNGQAGDGNLNG